MFGGGTDTSAMFLVNLVAAMVLNPHVQAKAQQELDAVLGQGVLPSISDKGRLPYIGGVVNEVLRLYPVLPLAVPHACFRDDTYRGYDIQKGTTVAIGRDPDLYENPEIFDPDRYLDPTVLPPPAFGWGRRKCPGIYFGETSTFIAAALVLSVFTFSKRKDSNGKEIVPRMELERNSLALELKPFDFEFKARSDAHYQLIIGGLRIGLLQTEVSLAHALWFKPESCPPQSNPVDFTLKVDVIVLAMNPQVLFSVAQGCAAGVPSYRRTLSPGDFSDQRFARYENALEILANIRDTVGQLDPQWSQDSKDQEFQGGFGYIKKAVWNNRLIAVKFLRDRQDGCSQKQPFRREVMVWHKLNHPNILPLLGVVSSGDTYLGMASPYMENGPASGYVHRNPEANVLQILCDVAAGMAYLASQTPPIAHGDLKGANVLIDSSGRACICDFGLSRFIEDLKSADVSCSGTMRRHIFVGHARSGADDWDKTMV
ncbi:cytochrome P450, putative [Rhizoctonia solani]|uniref:Cytochrome P450, putative n=1 Tax=Rhizoctonia solani TaxID=456999 RepID=A0A0K6FZI1_9AGAM|nr:cytochrome P450, putative [Rhizoctonia solani]